MPYDTGSITNARTIGIGLELTPDQQRQQERLAQLESLRFEYQQAYREREAKIAAHILNTNTTREAG